MKISVYNVWWLVFYVSLLPLAYLLLNIGFDQLGANPIQAVHQRLGDWALRFLCLTLAVTPLQTLTGLRGLADFRQMLGLYAWFYATLHVVAYLWLDQALQWSMIATDIWQSRYIWFGLLAYIILLLLAVSSSKAAKKILKANWKKLHRFIYLAAVSGMLHYFWQLKGNLAKPLFYALIIGLLLLFRVVVRLKNRQINRLMIPLGRNTEAD